MGMLCGTLDATLGDALVNGHSISSRRTIARRNLGICFQQDVIWNDMSVEDHLMLFGRLRGMHFSKVSGEREGGSKGKKRRRKGREGKGGYKVRRRVPACSFLNLIR